LPAIAQAGPREGVYIGAGGGLNYHQDSDIEGNRLSGEAEFDLGGAAMGVIGYAFGGPRVEYELSYRINGTDEASVANGGIGPIITSPDGDFHTVASMFNFYYDIDIGSSITPYIGAGLGGAYAEYTTIGDQIVFAYQGILGASLDLGGNLEGFADYRYFGTTKVEGSLGRAADIENRNQTLMVGLRYHFGPVYESSEPVAYTPPPAAPAPRPIARPVAPPPPAYRPPVRTPLPPLVAAAPAVRAPAERRFLVFFDFDSASVRSDGQRVIRESASASRQVAVTRIDVTGHADRSGNSRYNDRLSRRRANAVKRGLISNGVPEKDIIIYARGEREPLVPTRDGVREPQNRRVEIVLN
jgi:outer membrane protein OmpA-like peptidoglycan-associated protein